MKLVTLAASILILSTTVSAQDWKSLELKEKSNASFAKDGTINLLDSIGVEVKE